jgi:branched-chain amino acid transport system permease protein
LRPQGNGFAIIFNTTGIVNFAQGDFVMLGAIFSASLSSTFGLPLSAAVLLAVAGVAVVGALVESLGNPYGPNGRAALALMKLAPT